MLSKRRVESVLPDDPILEIPWEKLSEIGSESSLGLSLKNSLNRFLKTFGETSLLDDLYQSVLHGLDNLDGSGAFFRIPDPSRCKLSRQVSAVYPEQAGTK